MKMARVPNLHLEGANLTAHLEVPSSRAHLEGANLSQPTWRGLTSAAPTWRGLTSWRPPGGGHFRAHLEGRI